MSAKTEYPNLPDAHLYSNNQSEKNPEPYNPIYDIDLWLSGQQIPSNPDYDHKTDFYNQSLPEKSKPSFPNLGRNFQPKIDFSSLQEMVLRYTQINQLHTPLAWHQIKLSQFTENNFPQILAHFGHIDSQVFLDTQEPSPAKELSYPGLALHDIRLQMMLSARAFQAQNPRSLVPTLKPTALTPLIESLNFSPHLPFSQLNCSEVAESLAQTAFALLRSYEQQPDSAPDYFAYYLKSEKRDPVADVLHLAQHYAEMFKSRQPHPLFNLDGSYTTLLEPQLRLFIGGEAKLIVWIRPDHVVFKDGRAYVGDFKSHHLLKAQARLNPNLTWSQNQAVRRVKQTSHFLQIMFTSLACSQLPEKPNWQVLLQDDSFRASGVIDLEKKSLASPGNITSQFIYEMFYNQIRKRQKYSKIAYESLVITPSEMVAFFAYLKEIAKANHAVTKDDRNAVTFGLRHNSLFEALENQ